MEVPSDRREPVRRRGAGALLSVADGLAVVLTCAGIVGAGAAVIVRLRRSRGVERQQIKWFAYVASMIVAGLIVAITASLAGDAAWARVVGPVAWFTAIGMVAIGIPTRHRVRRPALPALRHRRRDQAHARLRRADRRRSAAPISAACCCCSSAQPVVGSRDRGLDAGGRGAVPAGARPHPGGWWTGASIGARTTPRGRSRAFGARLRDEVSLEALSDELRGRRRGHDAARARLAVAEEAADEARVIVAAQRRCVARCSAVALDPAPARGLACSRSRSPSRSSAR